MGLSKQIAAEVRELLLAKLAEKLEKYKPETDARPFHDRLFGRRNMLLSSRIHSLVTSLGSSVFEKVGMIIASKRFAESQSQYTGLKGYLSEDALQEIGHIVDDLGSGRSTPNRDDETRRVMIKAAQGVLREERNPRIDLFLKTEDGEEIYIDIKTPKPNKGECTNMKKALLEWVAIRASTDPSVKTRSLLGMPYNPYDPKPYDRWTGRALFDRESELLVGRELWEFLGGEGAYDDLLDISAEVGEKLRDRLGRKLSALDE